MIKNVAIVGAGFSGTLLALNLLRHGGPSATLIERRPVVGTGVAYGTLEPELVLNVRAGNMSAFPDRPDHFTEWLRQSGSEATAGSFVSRSTYGAYLRDLIQGGNGWAQDQLQLVREEVSDLTMAPDGDVTVVGAAGTITADAAVLAVGNLTPHVPPGLADVQESPRYRADPWATGVSEGLGPDDTVLLMGTGLTMVDVVLTLDAHGFRGKIVALSRRGLIPHAHVAAHGHHDAIKERPRGPLSELTHNVRTRASAGDWRPAVDELRPFTQGIWGNATSAERGRFLRHLRPWWDVHRHRLAPAVAERLAALIASGQLTIHAGKAQSARETDDAIVVNWRPRGEDRTQDLAAQRVVNCTGPQGDLTRATEPLLASLAKQGLIRPDPEKLGIDVDSQGRVIGADGKPNDRLLAVGPMTRGAFWEIVAVPDIRRQAWDVARRLSNAHWVGGEGL